MASAIFVVEKTILDMRCESGKVTVMVKTYCEAATRLLMLDTNPIGHCRFPYGIPSLVKLFAHLVEAVLGRLLCLVRSVGVAQGRLQTTGNIARVLLLVVTGLGDISIVELLMENLLGVLLGLLGGVGVVDGSLVAAGDLSISHFDGCRWSVRVDGSGCCCCCCCRIAMLMRMMRESLRRTASPSYTWSSTHILADRRCALERPP